MTYGNAIAEAVTKICGLDWPAPSRLDREMVKVRPGGWIRQPEKPTNVEKVKEG